MADNYTPKQRLLDTLDGRIKGALPVICPGGMMSMVCREAGVAQGPAWAEVHKNPQAMAQAALMLAEATGFENLGVPFCVTVEAEAMGSKVDYGNVSVEPHVVEYAFNDGNLNSLSFHITGTSGRMPVVLEAISLLKQARPDLPIIGNMTGPVSLATSLIDPNQFFRLLKKDKPFVHKLIALVTEAIASFAEAQIKAGADVISLGDPTASGEILGPTFFQEFAEPSLTRIIERIKSQGANAILHICGDINPILPYLKATGASALSFDAVMTIKNVRSIVGNWVLMGNLSTFLLSQGPLASIETASRRVIQEGIDIVAPACGLSTGTPAVNARALTDTVRRFRSDIERKNNGSIFRGN